MLQDTRAILRMLREAIVAALVLVLTVLILVAVAQFTPADPAEAPPTTGTPQEIGAAIEEALAER